MQVTLNIQDELYKELIDAGIDMQSKFDEYLKSVMAKKQFEENRAYFQEALDEVESGKVKLLSHAEVWQEIEKHTSN
ncbi:hypothetical protein MNB_SM-7-78 [hydrothermal vent metagenome]|uniref:RelB/StbD replicon stabilization protein (Antitoxin to RelE/StbE) n=1 Tax=hydrothermal vent metagenome TaxID=652676 RepID=A0A1W1C0R8_9ZZZZ